jgi:hypothetical protein
MSHATQLINWVADGTGFPASAALNGEPSAVLGTAYLTLRLPENKRSITLCYLLVMMIPLAELFR